MSKSSSELAGLKIESAEVKIAIEKTQVIDGTVDIGVKIGGAKEVTNASTITYNYTPGGSIEEKAKPTPDITKQLIFVLNKAATSFAQVQSTIDLNNGKFLEKNGFAVELAFNIKQKGETGFEFEVFGFGVNAGGEHSTKASHSIKLTFEKM